MSKNSNMQMSTRTSLDELCQTFLSYQQNSWRLSVPSDKYGPAEIDSPTVCSFSEFEWWIALFEVRVRRQIATSWRCVNESRLCWCRHPLRSLCSQWHKTSHNKTMRKWWNLASEFINYAIWYENASKSKICTLLTYPSIMPFGMKTIQIPKFVYC